MGTMWLIFLHGPPGVGKFTVGEELSSLTGIPLFHNHLTVDLLTGVFEFGSPEFVALREQIWTSVIQTAATSDHSLIFTFAPERSVTGDFPLRLISGVESAGGRELLVGLRCGEAELERRIEAPARRACGKLNSAESYRALRADGVFDVPQLPSDLESDTGALSAREAAQKVADRIRVPSSTDTII